MSFERLQNCYRRGEELHQEWAGRQAALVKRLDFETHYSNPPHAKVRQDLFHAWRTESLAAIEGIVGEDDRRFRDFDRLTTEASHDGLHAGNGVVGALINLIYAGVVPANQVDAEGGSVLSLICEGFHTMAVHLRRRRDGRNPMLVIDEYDVQYLMGGTLKMFFADVRAEECTPSYAGKSSRIDYLLKREGVGVEIKMTREGLSDKEIGTQLIEDIARYKRHPDCKKLICFVYDPENRIQNPRGLEDELSRDDGEMKVTVIVRPG